MNRIKSVFGDEVETILVGKEYTQRVTRDVTMTALTCAALLASGIYLGCVAVADALKERK